MNRLPIIFTAIFLLIAITAPSYARLYESPADAKVRYGAPVKESSFLMPPLLKGTKELRYHHHGWRIRSAYLRDQAVIMSYMKLARPNTAESILQEDEIQAILEAESGGYRWVKVQKGMKVTNSIKYQGYFNSSNKVWRRGDGAVAWAAGDNAVFVISREGLSFDIQSHKQKEKLRKASIKHF